jgi:hypothetical protein
MVRKKRKLADGQGGRQPAGTNHMVAHRRAQFQTVVAGNQGGRDQEHQFGGSIFADDADPGGAVIGGKKEDTLLRVGGVKTQFSPRLKTWYYGDKLTIDY